MPNKRKTRQLATENERPKAMLPEGDDKKEMEPEDRQKKLIVTIADFENEVKTRVQTLRNFAKDLQTKMSAACSLEIMKIPKHVREMKVSEFLKNGGRVNPEAAGDLETVLSGPLAAKLESASICSKKPVRGPLKTITEDEEFSRPQKPVGRRGRQLEYAAQNTTGTTSRTMRKTRHKAMETPSNQASSQYWGQTPLVTPKFDPRLPITPAVGRNPKPGENLMSVTGSPIYIDRRAGARKPEKNRTLVVAQGKELDLDNLTEDDLDENMTNNLRIIQEKLGQLIQIKGKY